MAEEKTIAIIGFGTAGVNAAIASRGAGFTGRIVAFSNIDTLPYSPILTSYYAGGEKTREQCFPWSEREIADLNVEIVGAAEGGTVESIDIAAHTITCAAGTFPYDKCLISTGSTPALFGYPADCGYNPLVLRSLDDADRMKAAFSREDCKKVLVSGASMVALKMLEAALDNDCEVTLVGMNPHVLDMSALPETAERFEAGLRAKGVTLKLVTVMAGIEVAEAGDQRLSVTFKDGSFGSFDEICVAHGMRSNLGFLAQGALEMDRAIIVDEFMRTSDADVYAAGDVVQALELTSGQKRIVGIWKTAAVQGFCAGSAMAAELARAAPDPANAYRGAIATNTIAVNGTLFISGGDVTPREDRRTEIVNTDDMTIAYVYERTPSGDGERLVGFNLTCDSDEAGSLAYDTGAMLTMRIESAYRK